MPSKPNLAALTRSISTIKFKNLTRPPQIIDHPARSRSWAITHLHSGSLTDKSTSTTPFSASLSTFTFLFSVLCPFTPIFTIARIPNPTIFSRKKYLFAVVCFVYLQAEQPELVSLVSHLGTFVHSFDVSPCSSPTLSPKPFAHLESHPISLRSPSLLVITQLATTNALVQCSHGLR